MFIDNTSMGSYLTVIADGDSAATGRSGSPKASRTRNDLKIRMKRETKP